MSKRTFQLLLVSCLVTGTLWAASDPFVGKWKLNPSKSKLTDRMKVEAVGANKYAFSFGGGFDPETVVADGTDQPGLLGSTLSVTVEGPDTWKVIRKVRGRTQLMGIWKLSQDGKALTDGFTGNQPDGSTFSLNYVYKRMAGSSGFAGMWESASEQVNSVFELQIQPYEDDGLSFITPAQKAIKNMKFDGKRVSERGSECGPRLCLRWTPGGWAQSRNDRQDPRPRHGHAADRAFSRPQDLDDDRAPGGSKQAEHPCV